MQRTLMRELAFKLVFEMEVQKEKINDEEINEFLECHEVNENDVKSYLLNIKNNLKNNYDEINSLIINNLKDNWSIDRISKVNISILRLAICEMIYDKTPYKVVINEAVELAKKYADETSPLFINGILASVVIEKNLDKKDN